MLTAQELDKLWLEVRKIATEVAKHFEGCHLTSYVLKGEKWATIGWGKAIPLSQHPKTITQAEADKLFDATLLAKQQCLQKEIPADVLNKLSPGALAGLLSWRYNVKDDVWLDSGCNTRKALVRGDIKAFLRWHSKWVNGEAGPMPGLRRRRRVEQELIDGKPLAEIKKANWHQGEY